MIIETAETLGAFGITDYDKVKSVYKKLGKKYDVTAKQFKSVLSAYRAYIVGGGKPATKENSGAIGLALFKSGYTPLPEKFCTFVLNSILVSAPSFPALYDLIDPYKAKQRKQAENVAKDAEAGKDEDNFWDKLNNPAVVLGRYGALIAGLVAFAVFTAKSKK